MIKDIIKNGMKEDGGYTEYFLKKEKQNLHQREHK